MSFVQIRTTQMVRHFPKDIDFFLVSGHPFVTRTKQKILIFKISKVLSIFVFLFFGFKGLLDATVISCNGIVVGDVNIFKQNYINRVASTDWQQQSDINKVT